MSQTVSHSQRLNGGISLQCDQLLGNPDVSPIFGSQEAMFDDNDKLMRGPINCWFIDDWL